MQQAPQFWSPSNKRSGLPDSAHLRLFALGATMELGAAIAQALGHPLAAHEERQFEDGEHKSRPLDTVGGMDVYVVQSLHGGCYARKDRRTKPNDPVITRYVASLFAAVGTDAIVTLEVHNPAAFENAFHCRTVALTAAPLFVGYVRALSDERHCVVSPDPGGVKRAELFREALEAALGRPIGTG